MEIISAGGKTINTVQRVEGLLECVDKLNKCVKDLTSDMSNEASTASASNHEESISGKLLLYAKPFVPRAASLNQVKPVRLSRERNTIIVDVKNDLGILQIPENLRLRHVKQSYGDYRSCNIFFTRRQLAKIGDCRVPKSFGYDANSSFMLASSKQLVTWVINEINDFGRVAMIKITDVKLSQSVYSNVPRDTRVCVTVTFDNNKSCCNMINNWKNPRICYSEQSFDRVGIEIVNRDASTRQDIVVPQHDLIVYDYRLQGCSCNHLFKTIWVGGSVDKFHGKTMAVLNFSEYSNNHSSNFRTVMKYDNTFTAAAVLHIYRMSGKWCGHVCNSART